MGHQIDVKEACVETLEEAILAEKRGANRLELCADLAEDGLTPSLELVDAVLNAVAIPVKVMVRPRGGDFCHSEEEVRLMEQSIAAFKERPVFGVVLGITTPANELDIARIKHLSALAKPLNVCVHKAIDGVKNPLADFKRLLNEVPDVNAVLTSGGKPTALEGAEVLKAMIDIGGSVLKVVVAGRVKNDNIDQLAELIGASEYHGRRIVGELS
ncbi:MAG: copper homeostasis protein CutC [Mangrovibacterium sp.]